MYIYQLFASLSVITKIGIALPPLNRQREHIRLKDALNHTPIKCARLCTVKRQIEGKERHGIYDLRSRTRMKRREEHYGKEEG